MIVLIRHAKSARPVGVPDRERPLADRGIADARLVGEFLGRTLAPPGVVLSSPANRAVTTATLVIEAAGWDATPVTDDRLYYGGVDDLIAVLAESRSEPVIAFGHEPTWSATVSALTGGGRFEMVTLGVAALSGSARPGGCTLSWMVRPALLGGGHH